MRLFMETLRVCLKINLKAFVTALDKVFVLHFLEATINFAPVDVLCIFGKESIMGSVLKSF